MKKEYINPKISIDVFDDCEIVTSSADYINELQAVDPSRRMQVEFDDMIKDQLQLTL